MLKVNVLRAVCFVAAIGSLQCWAQSSTDAAAVAASHGKAVVAGYLPDYRLPHWQAEHLDALTDVIFFSIEAPASTDSTIQLPAETLQRLGECKQQHSGLRLWLSVGGWERSEGFAEMTNTAASRDRFAAKLVDWAADHQFGGLDFDWEHPQGAEQVGNYVAFLDAVHKLAAKRQILISIAVPGWLKLGRPAYAVVDRVNLMSYDHDYPQATMEKSRKDVDQLLADGCPSEKICLGIPFYGRNANSDAKTYAQLVGGAARVQDLVDGYALNGAATVAAKVKYARDKHLAGVMIWELGQDALGERSLLRAIQLELKSESR